MVVAETVGFWFEADLFKSVLIITGLACHNIETCHQKNMVAAETVGYRFEADFVSSVPMIIGFGCHEQH